METRERCGSSSATEAMARREIVEAAWLEEVQYQAESAPFDMANAVAALAAAAVTFDAPWSL